MEEETEVSVRDPTVGPLQKPRYSISPLVFLTFFFYNFILLGFLLVCFSFYWTELN